MAWCQGMRGPTSTKKGAALLGAQKGRFLAHQISEESCALEDARYVLGQSDHSDDRASKSAKGKKNFTKRSAPTLQECVARFVGPTCRQWTTGHSILGEDHKALPGESGGCAKRPRRSLETKWGVIKHDVSKFCGVYKSILLLRESGTSGEDVLDRALDLYKVRHPKQQPFVFVHCWRLLKDIPRWVDVVGSTATPQASIRSPTGMPKRRTVAQPPGELEAKAERGAPDVDEVGEEALPKRPKRPQGCKSAKDEFRLR